MVDEKKKGILIIGACVIGLIICIIGIIFIMQDNNEDDSGDDTTRRTTITEEDTTSTKKRSSNITSTTNSSSINNSSNIDITNSSSTSENNTDTNTKVTSSTTKTTKTTKLVIEGHSGLDSKTCTGAETKSLNITDEGYFVTCFRVTCSNNIFHHYHFSPSGGGEGYKCTNGNENPLVESYSDGCGNYPQGESCSGVINDYCTRVVRIDCNKDNRGRLFETTTTTKAK